MAQTQKIYLGDHLIVKTFQGDFGVVTSKPVQEVTIEYLIVAGGGPGGFDNAGAGGAGGLLSGSTILTTGTYEVIVGDGGHTSSTGSLSGSNSDFLGQTSIGGGAGGSNGNGTNGGSGGGGGYFGALRPGGLGILGQGNNGATGSNLTTRGGGGGGAGSAATTSDGGAGAQWLDGNYYAGGGGGGVNNAPTASGGIGGGGAGGIKFVSDGQSGTSNTGGGGGGDANGSRGGSGIVIVRYESPSALMTGGDDIFTSGSYTYHKFLTVGTGSLTF